LIQAISHVIRRFSQHPVVSAIALDGSQATVQAGPSLDYDIYVYTREDIPAADRHAIGLEFSPGAQIVDYWGPGLGWDDPESNIHIDVIFCGTSWMEAQIDRTLV